MNKNGIRDFDGWIKIKKRIHYKGRLRTIKEGEVWWCKIGENVGKEICGKGSDFLRPVLIVYKLSKYNFVGVPLTSKNHDGNWYISFTFKNKNECAVLVQIENISVHRLHYKMGEVSQSDYNAVLVGLCRLFEQKISPNYKSGRAGIPENIR